MKIGREGKAVTGRNIFSVTPFWLSCRKFESGRGREKLRATGRVKSMFL